MIKFLEQETEIFDHEQKSVDQAVNDCSSITKLLVALSEHLEDQDEIGAELIRDFTIMFAEHENEKLIKIVN